MRAVILLIALFALVMPVQAQTNIRAEILPSDITVGQTATLRVSVTVARGSVPDVPAPRLPGGLNVVGTSQSTQISFSMPGGRTATLVREFIILASAPGDYTILPIPISVDGTDERTPPLQLSVTGSARPADTAATSDARLEVSITPDTVYVGQQATLVGELLVTPELQLRMTRPPGHEVPAPADFWLHELPSARTSEARIIDGRRFVGQRFYRAYFPLLEGRFSFAPAKVTFEAREGFLFAPRMIELRSRSPRVTVLPLPAEGRPADFKGAVGQFAIRAFIEPREIGAGDAVTLTLEVTGSGNMKALPAPTLPELPTVDVLPPSEVAEVTLNGLRVGGKKTFTWVLVPTEEGRVVIPPIRYPAFDPEARAYVVHESDSLEVQVTPNPIASRPIQLAPIRRATDGFKLDWVMTPAFLLMQLLPVVVLAWLLLRARRTTTVLSGKTPDQLARELRTRIETPEFAADAERAVLELARTRLGTTLPNSISIAEFETRLTDAGAGAAARSAASLLAAIRALRYTPGLPDRAARETVVTRFEALVRSWTRSSEQHALSIAPLLLPLLLLQAAPGESPVDVGVRAYEEGRIDDAVTAFEQRVENNPHDATAWYNLGNAQYRAGQRGSAAYAWLRAAQLEPRADDVATNLRAVGAGDVLARIQPLIRLNREESILLAATLWWLAIALACCAVVLRDRRRPLLLVSLAPLVLSGFLLASWAVQQALPPPAIVRDRGTRLMDAPNRQSETLAALPAATGLVLLERGEVWSRVRIRNGLSGWVESADITGL